MEYGFSKLPCKMQYHYSDKSHARTILRMNYGVHECALCNQLIIMRSCAAADDCTKLVTAYIYLGCARSFHQASANPRRFALLSFLEICFHLRTSVSTPKWDSYKFKKSETAITNYCCKKKFNKIFLESVQFINHYSKFACIDHHDINHSTKKIGFQMRKYIYNTKEKLKTHTHTYIYKSLYWSAAASSSSMTPPAAHVCTRIMITFLHPTFTNKICVANDNRTAIQRKNHMRNI